MAKYDLQLTELKNLLPTAKSILIALPAGADMDKLASGLALFLILEASGKQVSIVCDDNILVGQAHLFGVDHVQKTLPSTEGGNLTLTLEGVAASDNTVPALEKLDWFAENSNLNLVFHVLPGQTFQPAKILPHYQGSGFSLIFVVGAVNLNSLGNIYSANASAFSGAHIANIDNQSGNAGFGQTNVLDQNASSLSEIMANLITDLGYNLDADSASNLLAGIFEATGNLTNAKVTPDSYMVVANCLRVGGRKPGSAAAPQAGMQPSGLAPNQTWPQQDLSSLIPTQSAPAPAQPQPAPIQTGPAIQPIPDFLVPSASAFNNTPQAPIDAGDHTMSFGQQPQSAPQQAVASGSPEERPAGEGVISETPEPDWLTPKIFKGSSLG